MFERFTDRARRVLVLAQEEARLLNHSFIGTEHILLGLIHEGEGLAAKALESLGISLEAVREKVEETIGPAGTTPTGSPPFTPRAKKVLELSLREALQLGHNYIGTEHMLLGLVREGEGVAAQVLISLGADLSRVRQQVIQLVSSSPSSEAPSTRPLGQPLAAMLGDDPFRKPATQNAGSVTVTGEGRVRVRPDEVVLSLGARARGKTPSEALERCSKAVQAVTKALEGRASSLQSGSLHVRPNYDSRPGERHEIVGYTAESTLLALTGELDQAGAIATAALEAAGAAGLVHDLRLTLGDRERAESEARELAFASARAKAAQYASLAGKRLGALLELSEVLPGRAGPLRAAATAAAREPVHLPVEAGELEVTAHVFTTWELVD